MLDLGSSQFMESKGTLLGLLLGNELNIQKGDYNETN